METSIDLTRGFIALGLSDAARDALALLQDHLRLKGLSLACAHPEDAHLTLVFLGNIETALIDRLTPRLDERVAGMQPFPPMLGGGGFFGPPGSPRVAWVGVAESAALMGLQSGVAALVQDLGMPIEMRPFHPHLTVARIRSSLPPGALTLIKSSINNTTFGEVPVDRVLFMSSQPNGSGPRYKILHQSPLKGIRQHG